MAAEQKTLLVQADQRLLEDEAEGEEELRDTKDAFYQYVFAKAARDQQLTREESVTLGVVKEELESRQETHASGEAAEMGRRLAEIGELWRRFLWLCI